MSKECFQSKVNNFGDFIATENKDAVRWALNRMLLKYLFQQLKPFLMLHLMFDHRVQQEVHRGKKRANFLIWIPILQAVLIINKVKVQY